MPRTCETGFAAATSPPALSLTGSRERGPEDRIRASRPKGSRRGTITRKPDGSGSSAPGASPRRPLQSFEALRRAARSRRAEVGGVLARAGHQGRFDSADAGERCGTSPCPTATLDRACRSLRRASSMAHCPSTMAQWRCASSRRAFWCLPSGRWRIAFTRCDVPLDQCTVAHAVCDVAVCVCKGASIRFLLAMPGCRPCTGSMRCCRRSMGCPTATIGTRAT